MSDVILTSQEAPRKTPGKASLTTSFLLLPAWWVVLLIVSTQSIVSGAETAGPILAFVQPTNNARFSTRDEIPIVLRASAPADVFLSADVFANEFLKVGTAQYCCPLCPCYRPQEGDETILQIPVPRQGNIPPPRTWQGWSNVDAGVYRLTARAVGEQGTPVEAEPVTVTVLDLTLHIFFISETEVGLVIQQGSLVDGIYYLEASEDLRTWMRLGPFLPGNVAAFYYDKPPPEARRGRFYRAVHLPREP